MAAVTPIKKYPLRYFQMCREIMALMESGEIENLIVLLQTARGTQGYNLSHDDVNMSLSARLDLNRDLMGATIVDTSHKNK